MIGDGHDWPTDLPAQQVRFARPTRRLDQLIAFYGGLLGLPQVGRNTDDGWTVVMFGLPGKRYHLEFVSLEGDGIDGTAPTAENLLVLYFGSAEEQLAVAARLTDAGVAEVALDNPWWGANGAVAFPDPDGWRVVLMPRTVGLA